MIDEEGVSIIVLLIFMFMYVYVYENLYIGYIYKCIYFFFIML